MKVGQILCDDVIKTIVDFSSVNAVAKLQLTSKFFQSHLRADLAKKRTASFEKTAYFNQENWSCAKFEVLFHHGIVYLNGERINIPNVKKCIKGKYLLTADGKVFELFIRNESGFSLISPEDIKIIKLVIYKDQNPDDDSCFAPIWI